VIINGELRSFVSPAADFGELLGTQGQAFFDRTRYISALLKFREPVLLLRPRRFGKSLTVDMLAHFHGLQYMDAHKSIYQVGYITLLFWYARLTTYRDLMYRKILLMKEVLLPGNS